MKEKKCNINLMITASAALVFIAVSISAALLAISIYGSSSGDRSMDRINGAYTFVTGQVRECGDRDLIRTASLEGEIPALVIEGDREEWIYAEGGSLRILEAKKGAVVTPSEGKEILPLSAMDVEMAGEDMIRLEFSEDGESSSFNIAVTGAGGSDER